MAWIDRCIVPDWPAPSQVRACTTTRTDGASTRPYDTFNLAGHVGDRPESVRANREALTTGLSLPNEPVWLQQVHGRGLVDAGHCPPAPTADAGMASAPGVVCAVLTADCLPILLCDRHGTRVAALHGGWRGLAAGIIEAGVEQMRTPPEELLAWLGPAIGPKAFEVGPEVRAKFMDQNTQARQAFRPGREGRWLADIYHLARLRLGAAGVTAVYGGGLCTYADRHRFFSYRRDGVTGRMASLIWIDG